MMPPSPINNPIILGIEKGVESGKKIKARIKAQMGKVAFNIPARPGEMVCSPQNKNKNGIPCANKPITQIFHRREKETFVFFLNIKLKIIKDSKAMLTLTAAPKIGGHTATTSLIPIKEPLHKQARIMNNKKLILDAKGIATFFSKP